MDDTMIGIPRDLHYLNCGGWHSGGSGACTCAEYMAGLLGDLERERLGRTPDGDGGSIALGLARRWLEIVQSQGVERV
jgi:hypothetical protein